MSMQEKLDLYGIVTPPPVPIETTPQPTATLTFTLHTSNGIAFAFQEDLPYQSYADRTVYGTEAFTINVPTGILGQTVEKVTVQYGSLPARALGGKAFALNGATLTLEPKDEGFFTVTL